MSEAKHGPEGEGGVALEDGHPVQDLLPVEVIVRVKLSRVLSQISLKNCFYPNGQIEMD